MIDALLPIEGVLRRREVLDPDASLVLRGSPLSVEGVLANADRTRRRFTLDGEPFVAISVDVTVPGWDVESILSRRIDSRRSYAIARAGELLDAGYVLLPTFAAPHYSLRLPSYTSETAQRLIEGFGTVMTNPHYRPRR